MQQYKLAIIIPSWNCSKYIGEMLDSILANTFTDWKCFVVDDQSTDNSRNLIQSYHERDERIILKVRDREPKGAQTCRNIGFELSEGAEYVIWFDADDLIAPYCIEQRVAYMDRHLDLDFGIFPAKTFVNDLWEKDCMGYGFPIHDNTLLAMLHWTLPMVGWTNIYRYSSIKSHNISWDVNVMSLQDSDFNINCLLTGLKYDYGSKENAKIDYFYRMDTVGNSISNKMKSAKHKKSHLYLFNKVVSRLYQLGCISNQDIENYAFNFIRLNTTNRGYSFKILCSLKFNRHPAFILCTFCPVLLGKGYSFFTKKWMRTFLNNNSEWLENINKQLVSFLS